MLTTFKYKYYVLCAFRQNEELKQLKMFNDFVFHGLSLKNKSLLDLVRGAFTKFFLKLELR